ncbi:unnamed protein product, partial [Ectocarpus sp. 4 AP-2014]
MGGCSSRFQERGTHTAAVKRRDGGFIGEAWNKDEAAAAAAVAAAAAAAVPAAAAAPEILTVSSSSSPTTRTQCPCCPRPTAATPSAATTPKPFVVEVVSPQRRASGRASEVLVRRRRHPPTDFPVEILRSCIFGFLGAGCLQRASGACRAWRDAAVDEQLWKELCLRCWVGKHVALLEDCHHIYQQQRQQAEDGDEGETSEERRQQQQQQQQRQQQLQPIELAQSLRGGLEELVAAMPIKVMKRRLHELGANPARLAACLEKVMCCFL